MSYVDPAAAGTPAPGGTVRSAWGVDVQTDVEVFQAQLTAGTPAAVVAAYNISASMNQYSGSGASGQAVVTVGSHDFKVGQGIRVYGAGNVGATTPATPTISQGGTPGSTTYQYQVVASFNSRQVDACSIASTAGTTSTGAATLNATNYNKIQFAPNAGSYQMYSVYGNTSGSMNLIGHLWVWGPQNYAVTLVSSGSAPPYLGANLVGSTQYTYALTGVDFLGNETPVLSYDGGTAQLSVTTGVTPFGVNITWSTDNGMLGAFSHYNIYRATGAGPLQFLAQVNPLDWTYQDDGLTAPNAGQNPPTVYTFIDNGQPALTGTAGRPPHIPATPPAAVVPNSLFSTVNAVSSTTVTLANNLSSSVSGTVVAHDDSAAILAAANALGTVTLPNGYYPWGLWQQLPQGATLQGQAPPTPTQVTVTTTTNPLPNAKAATLVFTSLWGTSAQQSSVGLTHGCSARNLQLFWPYQINGTHKMQQLIPYQPGIWGSGTDQHITDLVDCNSYVGIHCQGTQVVERIWVGTFRYTCFVDASESIFRRFKGDPATVYSSNVNLPQAPDRSVIRATGGSGLGIVDTLAVDGATAVWWTLMQQGGGGTIPSVISNCWVDDWTPACVIDCPTSEPWTAGGAVFGAFISNFFSMSGGGSLNITNLKGRTLAGANNNHVEVVNSHFANGTNITGNVYVKMTNTTPGLITTTATQKQDTPCIRLALVACQPSVPRVTTTAGATKLYASASQNPFSNHQIYDTITGGTLYVIDEQGMVTEDFTIPAGTALTTASNPIPVGYIHVPQQSQGATNLYVISATGNGTSATDVWKVNASTLFTSSTSVSSQFVGGAGEAVGSAMNATTALYFYAGTTGTSFNVLPVTLTIAANITPTIPIKCRITYCISPISA